MSITLYGKIRKQGRHYYVTIPTEQISENLLKEKVTYEIILRPVVNSTPKDGEQKAGVPA